MSWSLSRLSLTISRNLRRWSTAWNTLYMLLPFWRIVLAGIILSPRSLASGDHEFKKRLKNSSVNPTFCSVHSAMLQQSRENLFEWKPRRWIMEGISGVAALSIIEVYSLEKMPLWGERRHCVRGRSWFWETLLKRLWGSRRSNRTLKRDKIVHVFWQDGGGWLVHWHAVQDSSGKKKEPKPKLLGPDVLHWGGGLPREGVGGRQEASITWCDLFWPKFGQKMPKSISLHDVLEPLKQALWASRDVIISSQICGSKLQKVFTLGDGCWLPMGGGKVRYVPRNHGNQTFLAGYLRILPGYPGDARKVWEKKSLCSILVP